AHPELRSRPTRPHPLFAGLVKAAVERVDSAFGSDGPGRFLNVSGTGLNGRHGLPPLPDPEQAAE
ncbi:hypothetical protein, partial [Streptomyces daghestanicus]